MAAASAASRSDRTAPGCASIWTSFASQGRWSWSYLRPSTKKRCTGPASSASKSTPSRERPRTRKGLTTCSGLRRSVCRKASPLPIALGNGLAFLHTLRRSPEQEVKPFLVLGRSREGVDFDALDAGPVHLFFVLGLKYDQLHLPWLAKLVQMLAQPGAVRSLLEAADAAAIYQRLSDYERKLEPPLAAGA